jgi:hypothetical protein
LALRALISVQASRIVAFLISRKIHAARIDGRKSHAKTQRRQEERHPESSLIGTDFFPSRLRELSVLVASNLVPFFFASWREVLF